MVNVAVNDDGLWTMMLLTVTPVPAIVMTVDPEEKADPLKVTETAEP